MFSIWQNAGRLKKGWPAVPRPAAQPSAAEPSATEPFATEMHDDANWNLLAKHLFGECSEEEAARLQAWIAEDPARRTLLEAGPGVVSAPRSP